MTRPSTLATWSLLTIFVVVALAAGFGCADSSCDRACGADAYSIAQVAQGRSLAGTHATLADRTGICSVRTRPCLCAEPEIMEWCRSPLAENAALRI